MQIILLDTSINNHPVQVVHHSYNMHLSYGHRKNWASQKHTQRAEIYFSPGEHYGQHTFIHPPKKIHVRKQRAVGQFRRTSKAPMV